MRIDRTLQTAAAKLARRNLATPFLDAEVMLAHVLGKTREYLSAYPERELSRPQARRFARLVAQRLRQMPVAYLTRTKEFYGLAFFVDQNVFIPRPETEKMVDAVMRFCRSKSTCHMADIGTGSGAIAVSVAKYLPRATVYAVDRSKRALKIAKKNAANHGVRIRCLQGADIIPLGNRPLDVVAANLPYLPLDIRRQMPASLSFEPARALWSGHDGLSHYRNLVKHLGRRRQQPDLVLCEMQADQQAEFIRLARRHLPHYTASATVVRQVAFVSLVRNSSPS